MIRGPYPSVSWSHSCHTELAQCARRYYHRTYGYWQGRTAEPEHPAWLTYRLRHLMGLRQIVGILVADAAREVVQRVVRHAELPDADELYERCLARLQRVRDQDLGAFLRSPQDHPYLFERYYGLLERIPDLWPESTDRLYQCILNLLESEVLEEVARCAPGQVLLVDSRGSVELPLPGDETLTVWAAPDLVYWSPDDPGVLVIVDWKTGQATGAREQLATYALYVRRRFQLPRGTRYRGRVVTLADAGDVSFDLTPAELRAAYDRILADVREMRRYVADPTLNRPVEPSLFPMLPQAERHACGWCSYRALCEPLWREEPGASSSLAPPAAGSAIQLPLPTPAPPANPQ